jgi:hypothetical protein
MDRAEIIERLQRLREKAANLSQISRFVASGLVAGKVRPTDAARVSYVATSNALDMLALDKAIGAVTREKEEGGESNS